MGRRFEWTAEVQLSIWGGIMSEQYEVETYEKDEVEVLIDDP